MYVIIYIYVRPTVVGLRVSKLQEMYQNGGHLEHFSHNKINSNNTSSPRADSARRLTGAHKRQLAMDRAGRR